MSDINETGKKGNKIQIRFDGPPGHESGRFVEVEDASGKSFRMGEWVEGQDGHWLLVFDDPRQIEELNDKIDTHEDLLARAKFIISTCVHEGASMGIVDDIRCALENDNGS
jgi:hypothetical protein